MFVPAIAAWDKFLHDFPNDGRAAKASYNRGFCLFQAKQFDKAQDALRKVIERYPRGEQLDAAYLYLGMAQYSLGQPAKSAICDTAVPDVRHPGQKFPQSKFLPDALFFRGECLYLRGKKVEAAQSYAKLAAKYASDRLAAQALYMAGFAALETGDYAAADAARPGFPRRASHRQPGRRRDARGRGKPVAPGALSRVGANLRAVAGKVSQPRRRLPLAGPSRDGRLYLQKKYRETIDALEPAMASIHAPGAGLRGPVPVGQQQAGAERARGGGEGPGGRAGRRSHSGAGRTRPGWPWPRPIARAGQLDPARANLRRLIADFPASPLLDQAHDRLGECCYLSGDYRSAAEAYQALVDRWPQSPLAPQALYALAAAQLDQKNLAAAERSLDCS